MDACDLNGPLRAVSCAFSSLHEGRVLISGGERRTISLQHRCEELARDNGYQVREITADLDFSSAATRLGLSQIEDVSSVATNIRLHRTLLCVDCSSPIWAAWARLLMQQMASNRGERRLRLWLRYPDHSPTMTSSFVHHLQWAGCLDQTDVKIYAADAFRGQLGPGPTSYLESLAREVAGPDFDLIDSMALAGDKVFDLQHWLSNCAVGEMRAVNYSGQQFESAVALAKAAEKKDIAAGSELLDRCWRAQVSELFPALERERIRYLKPYKSLLLDSYSYRPANPWEQVREIPADVEYGAASYRLRGSSKVPIATIEFLESAAAARNAMAHGNAIDGDGLRKFLTQAARSLGARWQPRA